MRFRYSLDLIVDGVLSDEDRQVLAEDLSSAASMTMCDQRRGDSGAVEVRFVFPLLVGPAE